MAIARHCLQTRNTNALNGRRGPAFAGFPCHLFFVNKIAQFSIRSKSEDVRQSTAIRGRAKVILTSLSLGK